MQYKQSVIRTLILTIAMLFAWQVLYAQQASNCPLNIDFEMGSFANWQCYTGYADTRVVNNNLVTVMVVNPTAPTTNAEAIVAKSNLLDKYGKFPIAPPDGSNFAIKLGNDISGRQASSATYTFTVPQESDDFTFTYSYAVVFRDGQHWASQQPRFTAKVYDVDDRTYVDCAAAEYVTNAALPGFQRSTVLQDVIYKSWSNVTLNFSAYKGKKLRIEFLAAGCTLGGHFCYAYVDIAKTCSNAIKGTDFCSSATNVTLTGPAGYAQYKWYNANRSQVLGTSSTLTFPTAPADGTVVSVDVTPYAGFGCANTTTAVLHNHGPSLKITNPAAVCAPGKADITSAQVIATTGTGIALSYWKNAEATVALAENPAAISQSGTYYVKAVNDYGCSEIKPVNVVINSLPDLHITDPAPTCIGGSEDITAPTVTTGSTQGLTLSYWADAAATQPLNNPTTLTTPNTYYIKAINSTGCAIIKPVRVTFHDLPNLEIVTPPAVCYPAKVNITASVTSTAGDSFNITYWKNATATDPLPGLEVSTSGTYYVKAKNTFGCEVIKAVNIVINPTPAVITNQPADVCKPGKIDLGAPAITTGSTSGLTFTYWKDENATVPLPNYRAVADSGRYYIKGTNTSGCYAISAVLVNIHALPKIVTVPLKALYQPKTVDLTAAIDRSKSTLNATYSYWKDASLSAQVTNPKAVGETGTYYIKAANAFGCYSVATAEVYLAPVPDILVPTAFTPLQSTNTKLYPFLKGIKTFKIFRVYNRWGNIVFETTDPSAEKGWDGQFKGSIAFLDTFTWVAEGIDYLGNTVHRSGNTVLLK